MMTTELTTELNAKYQKLKAELKLKGKVIIAFSGGVDSALLAKVAFDELGESAIAVLLNSETVPQFELSEAKRIAGEMGIAFEIIQVDQLSDDKFCKNDTDRCYYCRKHMAKNLKEFASTKNIDTIIAGAQATDLDDYRPGIKAFTEEGIWHPFIDMVFTKSDIRHLARFLDLPVSEKPAMACLSSRIPYDHKITQDNLAMVTAAEDLLRGLGFTQYRARTHDNLIRIEVYPDEFDKLMENRVEIIEEMKKIGYKYITLDLVGYRSGSMNEVIDNKKV
jgi:uncharacterized protein